MKQPKKLTRRQMDEIEHVRKDLDLSEYMLVADIKTTEKDQLEIQHKVTKQILIIPR